MVDALGVGDVGEVVLRDREILSQEGIVVVVIVLDQVTFEIINEPEVISRGFIYVRQSERLLKETKEEIKKVLNKWKSKRKESRFLLGNLQEHLEKFFFQKTGRRPLILIQIIKV